MIVTIDGPAGAGKSTVARIVASRLGLPYLNSGYIYRAVTVLALEGGVDLEDESALVDLIHRTELRFIDDPDASDPLARTRVIVERESTDPGQGRDITDRLKRPEVTDAVWRVANNGACRRALRETQRRCAGPRGLVAEGRDMGSVIFPSADLKVYLDASAEERAHRQHAEAVSSDGSGARDGSYEDVLASIRARDARDLGRADAPLVVPEGALVVRSDGLSVDNVVELVLDEARARMPEAVPAGERARDPST